MNRELSPFTSPGLYSDFKTNSLHNKLSTAKKNENLEILKEINDEIKDWVNSIGNLSPLLPEYSSWNFSEIGIAVLCVTISFSFKCLAGKWIQEKADKNTSMTRQMNSYMKKLVKLKSLYVEWIQKTIEKYKLNKSRVYDYNKLIKEYLAKVNES